MIPQRKIAFIWEYAQTGKVAPQRPHHFVGIGRLMTSISAL